RANPKPTKFDIICNLSARPKRGHAKSLELRTTVIQVLNGRERAFQAPSADYELATAIFLGAERESGRPSHHGERNLRLVRFG
ncbi:MAG: hypothetical protein ACLPJW_15570, partial [Rhodomicrobium sp.]